MKKIVVLVCVVFFGCSNEDYDGGSSLNTQDSICFEESDESPEVVWSYNCASADIVDIRNQMAYAEEAREWEAAYGLGRGWADWMILNRARYIDSYVFSRASDKHVTVSFRWWEGVPEEYDPAYASDEEYLAAIEAIAELQFPGWDFDFVMDLPDEESDVIVYSDDKSEHGAFCCVGERRNIIHLRVGWGFAHEFAHFLGIHRHHCNSIETLGMGENMPPGVSECLFDGGTDIEWCSAHRFSFDIPPDIENSDELYLLIGDMMDRFVR
jgi:hypothetical protein